MTDFDTMTDDETLAAMPPDAKVVSVYQPGGKDLLGHVVLVDEPPLCLSADEQEQMAEHLDNAVAAGYLLPFPEGSGIYALTIPARRWLAGYGGYENA